MAGVMGVTFCCAAARARVMKLKVKARETERRSGRMGCSSGVGKRNRERVSADFGREGSSEASGIGGQYTKAVKAADCAGVGAGLGEASQRAGRDDCLTWVAPACSRHFSSTD